MKLIAHRGLSSQAPENTFASFEASIINNFNIIEFDVQLTKDKTPVIIHDYSVNRTTNGSGEIKDINLKELLKLDAGSWFNKKFEDEKIPILEDVLIKYFGICHFQIELKSDERRLAEITLEILKKTKWINNYNNTPYLIPSFSITSFNINHIIRINKLNPEINIGWLYKSDKIVDKDIVDTLIDNNINMFIPSTKSPLWKNLELQRILTEKKITLCAWGAEDIKDVIKLRKTKAKAMTVNWPDEAKKYLL